jgi:TATA-box binding protein (TBP) (component of TFIID and TFIIIB)
MTATGYVGCSVNLNSFYENVQITDIDDSISGIVYAEYGSNKHTQIYKGVNLKKKFVRVDGKKQPSTKRFDNSVTIKLRTDKYTILNIKLFKNGKVQMTGVKSREQGVDAINTLIRYIKEIHTSYDQTIVEDVSCLFEHDFKIHLINSDFKVNMEIRRDLLYNILVNQYNVISTYEPCIYPGVKIQYHLNKNKQDAQTSIHDEGVCCCQTPCDGKGDGFTTDKCKKITISVFQSGCILITGVTSETHINIAYKYIVDILKTNQPNIQRVKLEIP